MANNLTRAAAFTLGLSAVGFAAYINYEGWSDTARPPVNGDVPTYGFGSTRGLDGQPLRGGEKIAPPTAVRLALRDAQAHESGLKRCMGDAMLAQREFDALMSLALNVGPSAVCASSIPAKARAGDYGGMCKAILGFDGFCTRPKVKDAAGKYICPAGAMKKLPGLTKRRQEEYRMCIGDPANPQPAVGQNTGSGRADDTPSPARPRLPAIMDKD